MTSLLVTAVTSFDHYVLRLLCVQELCVLWIPISRIMQRNAINRGNSAAITVVVFRNRLYAMGTMTASTGPMRIIVQVSIKPHTLLIRLSIF
jgi:hypothetical protein